MNKKFSSFLLELFILLIITIPSFNILFNNQYPSMHDDQHITRLYLLDQGIKQGSWYPRWVSGLGFGYGYPLFNFYPPLIYYVAELFHMVGFSYIWSIKLMIISGFLLAGLSIFWLIKSLIGRLPAFIGVTVYTYFFYHAVLVYIRGALAEFFTLAILPLVFLSIYKLYKQVNFRWSIIFGIFFALLILTHPLIAFPSLIFIGLFTLFLFLLSKNKVNFICLFVIGLLIGLGLSSFYWLPSMVERKFTLTDEILTKELANYKDHYIYPQQLWYSPWGFGGSVKGIGDGLTFQLGKIPITLTIFSLLFAVLYFIKNKKIDQSIVYYLLSMILLSFSLFMTTSYSSFIWDNIKYLWYLQFPWRFLTFTALFISIVAGYGIFFLKKYINRTLIIFLVVAVSVLTIIKYQQYDRPQKLLSTTDKEKTSYEEIAWRVSGTSYEFVPKGVKIKKTNLGTTTIAIDKKDLPRESYNVIFGKAEVKTIKNQFAIKEFSVNAAIPIIFRLNTYNFPGWTAYLDGKQLLINDNNDYKLITVNIPQGSYTINFHFKNTPVRNIADAISLITLIIIAGYFFYFHFVNSKR